MTIVVSVRVNDGIVLAADSATSFVNAEGVVIKVYNNANKIFNLVKVWPIGAMTYGAGSIGSASIATLSKDFRILLSPGSPDHNYLLNQGTYTVREVAEKAKRFLFEDRYRAAYPDGVPNYGMGYRICGYSAGATLPEAWEIYIHENECTEPTPSYDDDSFGPRWAGETEALDRIVLGIGSRAREALIDMGVPEADAPGVVTELIRRLSAQLWLPAMPIQDAIDLAFFLADTAARFAQFTLRAETVGGPIEVATITKHEGFKWVKRKHYYSAEYNLENP